MDGRSFYLFTAVQIIAVCGLSGLCLTCPAHGIWQRGLGLSPVGGGPWPELPLPATSWARSFAIRAEAHKLVTHGIYSKIRNPIYVFGTVVIAGFVVLIHRPIGWLLVLAIIVMQALRARREAQLLEAAFGDAYREYRRHTWF